MRLFAITLFIVCTGLLISCKKNRYVSTDATLSIKLHGCANTIFQSDAVSLCFDSIISDSRCPANAMCIWQGTATCRFLFLKNNEVYPVTLATFPWVVKKDTTLLGYKLEFISLNPYPGLPPVPPPGNEIRAEVKITKL